MYDSKEKGVQSNEQAGDDITQKQKGHNPHLENFEMFMPTEPIPSHGFYYNWGHMAIFSYLLGRAAVKRLYPLVAHTLLPILKLCSDNRKDVEDAFKKIQELNEKIRFFDSPYEKYRKIYGNYVREIEWCCVQFRRYFTKRALEDLIIDSTYLHNMEVMGKYINSLNKMMVIGKTRESLKKEPGKRGTLINKIITKYLDFSFKHIINITFWMVGDVEIEEYNLRTGEMVMKVPDCLMLRAPRMRQLPEDACVLA